MHIKKAYPDNHCPDTPKKNLQSYLTINLCHSSVYTLLFNYSAYTRN